MIVLEKASSNLEKLKQKRQVQKDIFENETLISCGLFHNAASIES
jgi:hypothetical protein